jgi:divalent metal cation (Fe/Co/Zn/Cd) transporter
MTTAIERAQSVEEEAACPPPRAGRDRSERAALERRAFRLAVWANVWHVFEFAVSLAAGIVAGSIALVAFGIDSLVELLAGGVIMWLFTGGRGASEQAERRAQQLIAASFFLLAAYVLVDAVRALVIGARPEASWVGIGLAAVTIPVMLLLTRAKRHVGRRLGSGATVHEAEQNLVCTYLSVALLIGLLLNAVLGWWWADPAAALVIAVVAAKEGIESWRGEECCD